MAEISMADISKTRQFTPKLSRLINSNKCKRKHDLGWTVALNQFYLSIALYNIPRTINTYNHNEVKTHTLSTAKLQTVLFFCQSLVQQEFIDLWDIVQTLHNHLLEHI